MVLADSDGIPRVPPYSGALLCQLSVLHTGLSPSLVLLSNRVLLQIVIHVVESPTTPVCMHTGLGSSRFARRYSGNRFFFLFLRVMRCFSSPRLPRHKPALMRNTPSRGVRSVLHRLLVPRHSPCALIHLTIMVALLLVKKLFFVRFL